MSRKQWPLPTSSSRQNISKNEQGLAADTSRVKKLSEGDAKNVVIAPDGSIFVKTLVQIDRKFMI